MVIHHGWKDFRSEEQTLLRKISKGAEDWADPRITNSLRVDEKIAVPPGQMYSQMRKKDGYAESIIPSIYCE